MPVVSNQEAQDWLGLPQLDSLALSLVQRAERHVCRHLGWGFICQRTIEEYYPLDQSMAYLGADPPYIVNSGHTQAVPANYYSANIIQLRHVPVRPTSSNMTVVEDWTGFYGQMPGSFPDSGTLEFGTDYFVKVEEPAQNGQLPISYSGQLVRRTFWFPNIPGSVRISYVAGFSDAELAGDYSDLKDAVLETLADLYLRAKAVGLGHFSDIASESDGGGVSVSYRDRIFNAPVPDRAVEMLERFTFCGEIAL